MNIWHKQYLLYLHIVFVEGHPYFKKDIVVSDVCDISNQNLSQLVKYKVLIYDPHPIFSDLI